MAHKTFISYKYDEARSYRDVVIDALGDDGQYYRGETAESPNISSLTVNSIKRRLGAMIYDTTVTIVLISPFEISTIVSITGNQLKYIFFLMGI